MGMKGYPCERQEKTVFVNYSRFSHCVRITVGEEMKSRRDYFNNGERSKNWTRKKEWENLIGREGTRRLEIPIRQGRIEKEAEMPD